MSEENLWLAIVETEGGTEVLIVEAEEEKDAVFEAITALASRGGCCGGTDPGDKGCSVHRLSELEEGGIDREDSKYYIPMER